MVAKLPGQKSPVGHLQSFTAVSFLAMQFRIDDVQAWVASQSGKNSVWLLSAGKRPQICGSQIVD